MFFVTACARTASYDVAYGRALLLYIHVGEPEPESLYWRDRRLFKRVFQHKWKEHEGFTARYNCDRLVWFERHQFVQDAIAREKELKGWSRSKKIALIDSINAAWVDLSRDWYDCERADYLRNIERFNS